MLPSAVLPYALALLCPYKHLCTRSRQYFLDGACVRARVHVCVHVGVGPRECMLLL